MVLRTDIDLTQLSDGRLLATCSRVERVLNNWDHTILGDDALLTEFWQDCLNEITVRGIRLKGWDY